MRYPGEKILNIVEDDDELRATLATIAARAGWRTVEYPSGDEFFSAIVANAPTGVLLLDLRMPGTNGIGVFNALRNGWHLLPTLFLTAHGDVTLAVEMVKRGAHDFLIKPVENKVLLSKLNGAWEWYEQWRGVIEGLPSLTEKERELLLRVCRGMSGKEVSAEMEITVRTVEFHKGNILRKLGIGGFTQLIPFVETIKKTTQV